MIFSDLSYALVGLQLHSSCSKSPDNDLLCSKNTPPLQGLFKRLPANFVLLYFKLFKNWFIFKLPPNETDKDVWLPLRDLGQNSNHSHLKYMSCEIYINPENLSLGTQARK